MFLFSVRLVHLLFPSYWKLMFPLDENIYTQHSHFSSWLKLLEDILSSEAKRLDPRTLLCFPSAFPLGPLQPAGSPNPSNLGLSWLLATTLLHFLFGASWFCQLWRQQVLPVCAVCVSVCVVETRHFVTACGVADCYHWFWAQICPWTCLFSGDTGVVSRATTGSQGSSQQQCHGLKTKLNKEVTL